jgi:hypothetical protein
MVEEWEMEEGWCSARKMAARVSVTRLTSCGGARHKAAGTVMHTKTSRLLYVYLFGGYTK